MKENETTRRPASLSLRHIFGSGSYLFFGGLGSSVVAFGQGVIVARTLGPANYGIWGVALALCAMTQALLGFRTIEPLTRYLVQFRNDGRRDLLRLLMQTAFLTDLVTRLAAFVAIVAVIPFVAAGIVGGEEALPVYRIVSLTVILTSADSLWYCVVRDQKRFKFLAAFPFVFVLLQLVAVVVCWQLGIFSLVTLGIIFAATAALRFVGKLVCLLVWIRPVYGIHIGEFSMSSIPASFRELRGFWRFMGMTYVSSVISALVKNGDLLILGAFRPESEVGLYRLARNMANLIHQVATSLAEVVYQDISELVVARKIAKIKTELARVSRVWVPTVLVGIVVALFVAKPAIRFVYGEDYTSSTLSFSILMLGIGIAMMLFWTRPMGLALEKLRANLAVVAGSSVFFLLSGLLLVPEFGQYGMAASLSGTWAVGHLGMLVVVWR